MGAARARVCVAGWVRSHHATRALRGHGVGTRAGAGVRRRVSPAARGPRPTRPEAARAHRCGLRRTWVGGARP